MFAIIFSSKKTIKLSYDQLQAKKLINNNLHKSIILQNIDFHESF
jgi:hypothetical protein